MKNRYLIVIEKAESNYGAYSPDIPGCVATGKTIEETRKTMEEAIRFHIEGFRRNGMDVPEPSSVPEFVTVP